ncbi:MAG: hypothetical protein CMH83_04520 [Nocardioides sp.]|nr:hypothetical protein [Nocardioides sp.]
MTSEKVRTLARTLLDPGEELLAVVPASNQSLGMSAGNVSTSNPCAAYLRHNGIVEQGFAGAALFSYWALTPHRLVALAGTMWSSKPKKVAVAVPRAGLRVWWADQDRTTRLLHVLPADSYDTVRMTPRDADGDAFLAALGEQAQQLA